MSAMAGACFRLLGAPKTVSLANSLPPRPTLNLRPSPRVRHIAYPISPGRPNAHPRPYNLAQTRPIRSPVPEKTSLSRATQSPVLTHPTPRTTHVVPTSAPFLPTNPPQSRNFATALEIYAHPCYLSPTVGAGFKPARATDPAARGNPTPKRGKAPGIRRGVPRGRPVAVKTRLSNPAPSLLSSVLLCHAAPLFVSQKPAPALQIRAGPATPSATRRTEWRRNEQTSPSREACPRGNGKREQRCRGAPSNLKQAPYLRKRFISPHNMW